MAREAALCASDRPAACMPSVTREKAPMTRKGNTPSDGKKTPETGKKNIMVGHPHETSKVMNAPPCRAERNGNTIKKQRFC